MKKHINLLKHNKKGFTLIEVLVTIALIAIIIPVLYNFISFGNNVFSKGTAKAESQNDVNLIAYKISNQLRTVSDISLTAKTGYSEFNVKTDHPDLDSIEYKLSKVNGNYLLNFVISESNHQIVSEIALNNVTGATTGSANDIIWVLYTESVSLKPTIIIGNASELFRSGDPTKTITFPVKTTNIPNNALLTAELQGSHSGLSIVTSPLVVTNNAELKINVNSIVAVGAYNFKLSYPGVDDVTGTIQILDYVNNYTVTFNKNGGDTQANPASIQVQEGVSLGTAMPTNPTRTGYSFIGWNNTSNGLGTTFNENSLVASNSTVYAQWAITSFVPRIDSIELVEVGVTPVSVYTNNTISQAIKKNALVPIKIKVKGQYLENLNVILTNNELYSVSKNADKTEMVIMTNINTPNGNNQNFMFEGEIKTLNNVSKPFGFKFETVN